MRRGGGRRRRRREEEEEEEEEEGKEEEREVTKYDKFSTFCSLKEMINKYVSEGKLRLTDAFGLLITSVNKASQEGKINVLRGIGTQRQTSWFIMGLLGHWCKSASQQVSCLRAVSKKILANDQRAI